MNAFINNLQRFIFLSCIIYVLKINLFLVFFNLNITCEGLETKRVIETEMAREERSRERDSRKMTDKNTKTYKRKCF